jgi:hypothetical protein
MECTMIRKLLVSALAAGALAAAAVPASAQFYAGAGPYGAGVQIGPFAAGVGPGYGWGHDYWGGPYADAGACRVIRERTVTPTGEVVFTTHRACY